MPATCWLTPIVTVSRPISAPAAAPTAIAAAIPSHSEPDFSAARKPPNAPAYIVPSMPRLSTPVRSPRIAPRAPYASGVAIVNIAVSTASQEMLTTASATRSGSCEGQCRHDGEQQDGGDDVAHLLGDLQHERGVLGADGDVAEQQTDEQHAAGGEGAERGDDDAGVAVAGGDRAGELVLHAEHLARPGEPGDRPRQQRRRPLQVGDPDSAEARRRRCLPSGLDAQPDRRQRHHDRRGGDRHDADQQPGVDPIAAEDRRQLVAGTERLGVGKPALRMPPRSVEQTLQQQQGHRVEQQRRDHLVDAGDPLEPGRQQRPQQTGGGAGRQSERAGRARRPARTRTGRGRWRRSPRRGTAPRRRCCSSRRGRRWPRRARSAAAARRRGGLPARRSPTSTA